jgi:dTDP-4-amino-4,6-dideoxygalactose transaminase
MWPRHQLAAYSPIPASAIVDAATHAFGVGSDPRGALAALLAREYAAAHVVLCGSGTQALQLAIELAKRRSGAPASVALPGFSCFDVASAAVGANTGVACYDIDPDTLGPDLDSLERVLRGGAGIVVVAPLYGIPVPWDEIEGLAARHGALVIEDAAQGHGAAWRGRVLGTIASISTLSFGRGKGWTGGEGGALLLRGEMANAEPASILSPTNVREANTIAALAIQWGLGRPSLYGIPRSIPGLGLGETQYHPPAAPRSITRAAAAGVLGSRDASCAEAEARRRNAAAMLDAISGRTGLRAIRLHSDSSAGYLRLPILMAEGGASFRTHPDASRAGIAASYPIVLAELPALRDRLVHWSDRLTGASVVARRLLTLPTHSRVGVRERERMLRMLDAASRAAASPP